MHSPVRDDLISRFSTHLHLSHSSHSYRIPEVGLNFGCIKNTVNKELSHESGHFKATFIENRSYSFMKIAQTLESAEWTPEVVNLCANRPPQ